MKLFPWKRHGFYSLFFCLFLPLEKRNWTVLWGGETLVPCGEKEGLCVWSVSDHTGKVHQHVCGVGWAEKYEVQCEERPLGLQAVSGKGQQDPGLCCQHSGLPRDGSSCFFSDSFFFKNSLFTCGTDYLESRDGLTAVRQLSTSFFFVLFFQQQKVFLPLMPSCQILMSWCMLNVMHILCSVKLLSLRGSWLSGCLCYYCILIWSILFLASTFDICSWELFYLFLTHFSFAVQNRCDCRYSREGRGWDISGQVLYLSYQMVSDIFCWTRWSEQEGKTAFMPALASVVFHAENYSVND